MSDAHLVLNAATDDEAARLLARCCGARRWVQGLVEQRPFASRAALDAAADELWAQLAREDYVEAFAHHPRIGDASANERHRPTADWSRQEQSASSTANAATAEALARANAAYEARFGFVFLLCATGRSAAEILRSLESRLDNDPETELRVAAGELAQITRLRLDKLTP